MNRKKRREAAKTALRQLTTTEEAGSMPKTSIGVTVHIALEDWQLLQDAYPSCTATEAFHGILRNLFDSLRQAAAHKKGNFLLLPDGSTHIIGTDDR